MKVTKGGKPAKGGVLVAAWLFSSAILGLSIAGIVYGPWWASVGWLVVGAASWLYLISGTDGEVIYCARCNKEEIAP